ncbi:MAG TPA: VWA domain-containing protein [Gemmatimonadaceae bacterium]|nr:VWA domain-containing protein [Gemmatimonadaceae bacterium]
MELADQVLRYEVTERFVNRGGRVGEADYMFPLPQGAAFQELKLSIDGELVAGETMSAERARAIYEEIVRRQRDPALVEWMGYGMLRTRIFPINPGEEKTVVVRFQMVARREGSALRVDYVRGIRREQAEVRRQRGRERTSFTLLYPRTRELGEPYSPTHTLDIGNDGSRRRVDVRGDAREVTVLIPVRRGNAAAIAMLPYADGRDDGFAMITLSPPTGLTRSAPRDVTFVLDVSGSMSGRKLEQARAAGKQLLATLSPRDRFRLVDFSTDVRTFRDDFVLATPENVRAAERYLDDLEAQGSTNIMGALEEALGTRTRGDAARSGALELILFMTDGEPTVGERDPARIAERADNLRGSQRIFTFGVGADLSVALLEQLALEGGGTAHFVRAEENPEHVVSVVASRLTNPVVTDVRVRAEGVRLHTMLPSGAMDVFAGQDLVVLARYDGSGRARLRFEGQTQNGPVIWENVVEFPDRERGNNFIPRLWATQRVGWLSAEKRKNGGSREVDDEIKELGERYGIPTEFSSYLVLEPGMVADGVGPVVPELRRGRGGAAAPVAPPAVRQQRDFESAKRASAQRAATSMAEADAVALKDQAERGISLRRVGDRVFVLTDGVWTDSRVDDTMKTIRIKAFSAAYFKVLELVPELREVFALGDRVRVAGRDLVIETMDAGTERLSDAELQSVQRGY